MLESLSSGKPKKYQLPSDDQITDEVELRMDLVPSLIEPSVRAKNDC